MTPKTLEAMAGKNYLFNGRRHKIIKARQAGDKIEIVTDKEWLSLDEKEVRSFLPAAPDQEVSLQILPKNDDTLSTLRGTVLQTIEKLKADKAYIDQANAINGSIKTIIDLAKLELDAYKLMNKME